VTVIEALRREHKWSAARITFELRQQGVTVGRRTVSRHLQVLGLNRRRFIDPNGETNRKPQVITARRPGHMVHLDVKKVGRIPEGGGWRVHGKGSAQAKAVVAATAAGARAGYVFLHTAVDGYSRLAYTEALPDEKATTAVGFMHRARIWLAAHGITWIERIVTDNGACYRADAFARAMLGARHQRIRPYTPRHNGKVERYNRILAEEFLYSRTWTSEHHRAEALEVWNIHYNYHRPHSAAGGQPPASQFALGVTNVLPSYT
jgi:transposase InsO family protein